MELKPFKAVEALNAKPENGCSWPIGDLESGNFKVCGAKRARHKSYCPSCLMLAQLALEAELIKAESANKLNKPKAKLS